MSKRTARVRRAYEALLARFGPQDWWPGGSAFEIMAGAVLTQNAAWANAERALGLLREAGALEHGALLDLPVTRVEELVRPAGAWRRKSRTLVDLAGVIGDHEAGLSGLLAEETRELRRILLAVRGIGPETADAILLYVAGRPVFVVDAYARRFLERHGIVDGRARYEEIGVLFEDALGDDTAALGECHALLVALGKRFCRAAPLCGECPLREDLPEPESRSSGALPGA